MYDGVVKFNNFPDKARPQRGFRDSAARDVYKSATIA
jgi:hypothetical protein